MAKQDKVVSKRKGEVVRDAKEVVGAARKAANKQIGDTAIPAPKTKSTKHSA